MRHAARILSLLLVVCTQVRAEPPSIEWDPWIYAGYVPDTGPLEEGQSRHATPFAFAKGTIEPEEMGSRLVAHALVGGRWVENPYGIHVERLGMRTDGQKVFTLQIPVSADWDTLELFLSLVEGVDIRYTFPSKVIRRKGESDFEYGEGGGRPLPAGTVLDVLEIQNLYRKQSGYPAKTLPNVKIVIEKDMNVGATKPSD